MALGKKRKQIVVGIVLVALLVVSTLGFSLMSSNVEESDSSVNEFGVDFFMDGGLWKIVFGEDVFGFQYLPSEVSDVFVNGSYDFGNYVDEVLYFVDANEGASEILNNLGRYVLRYQDACAGNGVSRENRGQRTEEDDCEGDLPLKGCDSNLIIFVEGNETMVWGNGSCVYIVGDGVRGADAFLYKALKIS